MPRRVEFDDDKRPTDEIAFIFVVETVRSETVVGTLVVITSITKRALPWQVSGLKRSTALIMEASTQRGGERVMALV